jgi:hypothetical protein
MSWSNSSRSKFNDFTKEKPFKPTAQSKGKADVVFDNGHEFSTHKVDVALNTSLYTRSYEGFFTIPDLFTSELVPIGLKDYIKNSAGVKSPSPWTNSSVLGNRAFAKLSPTKPQVSLANALGEFARDGVPDMVGMILYTASIKSKVHAARALGSEYLNVQFGWTPFIKDLQAVATALLNIRKNMKQFDRDANRLVRRSLDFPRETSIVRDVAVSVTGGFDLWAKSQQDYKTDALAWEPIYTRTTETLETQYRYSGAFQYYLSEDEHGQIDELSWETFESRLNQLLGTRLTPEVLWNLAPWSWMADWFANTGDNLAVYSMLSNDRLVQPYGYIMRKQTRRLIIQTDGKPATSRLRAIPPTTSVVVSTTKERRHSTPYGFGLTWDGFSPTQLAVLSSLGLSSSWGKAR